MKTIWKIIFTILFFAIIFILFALVFDWGRKEKNNNEGQNLAPATSTEIVIYYPKKNDFVTSPIIISGKAKGNWFFEASFPVKLVDENENVVGIGIATAQGDWMTSDFVNFTAEISYDRSKTTDSALLVFSNDNPSGMPELSKSFYIPIKLK